MIFQGDIRIKTALQLGFEDISKNPWLLDDILKDTVSNSYLRERYGSQISSAKQWLANNRINFFMSDRDDKVEFPCIVIEMGSSNEKSDMKHMADLSTESIRLLPQEINKPIPYVIKPVSGTYNSATGIFTFGSSVSTQLIAPEMVLVDPTTGNGYIVQSVVGENQIALQTGLSLTASIYGVIPKYQYYEAKVGHTFMQESYKITCNGNDQQTLLWLHSIAVYSLLRYRQVLLEKDGFSESMISSTKMFPNPDYSDAGQTIWSREINLTGQIEQTFIMQPHRFIEDVQFPVGGIRIISNITDTFEDLSTVNWSTIRDVAEQGDQ